MKTTFDLPERLIRRAKAAAAKQGRPLRDLVAEVDAKLMADQAAARAAAVKPGGWEEFRARLVQQADGTWLNCDGIEDEGFFKTLDSIRNGRLTQQGPRDPFLRFRAAQGSEQIVFAKS